jgi:hypothetical protein
MGNTQELNSFLKQLTKNQKWSLGGLAFFAVLIFVMWFMHMRENIILPIYGGYDLSQIQTNDITGVVAEDNLTALQKKTDTDQDGLSDWDESNVYNTSPYLPDTDGEGIMDGAEVKAGTNPNCPEGQDCAVVSTTNTTTQTPQTTTDNTNSNTDTNVDTSQTTTSDTASDTAVIQQVFGDNPDAATIRAILAQNGMTQEQLAQYTDEQLIATFQSLQQQ